jgi:hypothetical protein
MRIQIALSSDDKKEENTSNKAPAPQGFGKNYDDWMTRMRDNPKFKEVKRLDNNKLVAVDEGGNTIESFVIPIEGKNLKTDTMDGEQAGFPKDKTENDTRVDSKVEKGA